MTGALVILAALVVIGLLLFITDKKYYRHHHHEDPSDDRQSTGSGIRVSHDRGPGISSQNSTSENICCGQHLVCEKTSLSIVSDEIIYYDDEELDRFAGRKPESYSFEETEEFRDVLLTLLPEDVAGWARSITMRKIELPTEIKDELLLLVSEMRS